ncbi:MAG: hypothetical protein GY906_19940 [bacterium]|nr:hypothetical protein [bacterium]
MGLREKIVELIRRGDSTGLESLAAAEPRAVRHLLGRLWDVDEQVRCLSARALGASAKAHPELGVEVVRRLIWALNDESAMNGVFGLVALGEIGYSAPKVMAPFVGPMTSYLWDDGLRLEILRALARIAKAKPKAVAEFENEIRANVDLENPREREVLTEIFAERDGGSNGA